MINRFLFFTILVFGLCAFSLPGRAQQCDVASDLIVNLRVPSFGSYNVWDTVAGEKEEAERFKDGFVLPGGHVFAVAERANQASGDMVGLALAEVKRNGRPAWFKPHDVAGLESVVAVLPHAKGAVVLGTKTDDKDRKGLWFGVFDLTGALVSQKDVFRRGASLEGFAMERLVDGKGYLISAAMRPDTLDQLSSSVMYHIDEALRVHSDKAIVTGYENRLYGLNILPGGDVLGTGYLNLADGRKAGWIVRLSGEGEIKWQQSYPRGAGAQLAVAKAYINGQVIVAGTALPSGREGNRAGWVMVVDASNGKVGWQRYYVSNGLAYLGRDILISDDNLISVLMDGDVPLSGPVLDDETGEAIKEHVQLLTLNPRGVLFISDGLFNGEAVDAYKMILGPNNERIIIGESTVDYDIENPELPEDEEPEKHRTQEAWLAAATPMEPYDDPCVMPLRFLP